LFTLTDAGNLDHTLENGKAQQQLRRQTAREYAGSLTDVGKNGCIWKCPEAREDAKADDLAHCFERSGNCE
jgi:hypothetical protein